MLKINALADSFSSILMNIIDFEKLLENVTFIFTDTMTKIDEKQFLNINFLEEYENYPKYPTDFRVIHNLNKYNVLSIYNCAQNDTEYLIDAISKSNVLSLKNGLDPIPSTEVLRDYNLQTTFFTKIYEDFFDRNIINDFSKDGDRRSYLYRSFGYALPKEVKESSFFLNYSVYLFILKNLKYSFKIFESIFQSKAYLIRKNKSYADSFDKYVDKNSDILADALVKFIMAYTYKVTNPSGTFLKKIVDLVSQKLHDLKNIFRDDISIRDSITAELVLYGSELFYQYFAAKFANSAVDPSIGVINNDSKIALMRTELEIYENVLKRYSPQALREYLYLVYHYKLTPKKFLNILQLILQQYTKQNLIDYNKNEFNFSRLQSYFYQIFGTLSQPSRIGLNLDILGDLMSQIATGEYIIETMEQQRINEFSTRVKLIQYFEDIFKMENKVYSNFIDELYSVIFGYLKDTTQVDPYYPHYFNRNLLFWYLGGCLKRDVFQNKIFMKEEIELSELFYDYLSSSEYSPSFNLEKMRTRTVQFIEGNINKIGTLFENILETAVEKKLHSENITYFLN